MNDDGSQPNCFFTGSAKGILTDKNDVQIDELDPITATASEGGRLAFASWNALSTYRFSDLVTFDVLYYRCHVTTSQGQQPSISPEDWTEVKLNRVWNTEENYLINDIVQEPTTGSLYSAITDNSAQNPLTFKADWKPLSSQVYSAVETYKIGEIVSDDIGLMWRSLIDDNLNNTPNENPDEWDNTFLSTITVGITASTTQTQAAATALTTDINEISVCANSSDSVKFRSASAGLKQTIINNGAFSAQIFPDTDDTVNGGAVDAADPILLPPNGIKTYISIDDINWQSPAPPAAGGLSAPLSTVIAASSATVIVDETFDGTFDVYLLTANNITWQNTDNDFVCELKIGGVFQTANYFYGGSVAESSAVSHSGFASEVDTKIQLSNSIAIIGNESRVSGNLKMYIFNPTDTVHHVQILWEFTTISRASNDFRQFTSRGSGRYDGGTGALTGIKFFADANGGNLVTGTFRLQGYTI